MMMMQRIQNLVGGVVVNDKVQSSLIGWKKKSPCITVVSGLPPYLSEYAVRGLNPQHTIYAIIESNFLQYLSL